MLPVYLLKGAFALVAYGDNWKSREGKDPKLGRGVGS